MVMLLPGAPLRLLDTREEAIELRHAGAAPGSRLFNTIFGGPTRQSEHPEVLRHAPKRLPSSSVLHVEPKLHHVPILNNVVFSFDSELARFSRFRE